MSKQNSSQNKKSPVLLVLVVALVVICALLGVIVYLLVAAKDSDEGSGKEAEKPKYNIITADNVEEVVKEMEQEAEQTVPVGAYEVSMNTEWLFPDGESPSTNAFVENSTANTNTVYFTIALADNSEEDIYRSPYMEVGSQYSDITLDTPLDAGTYKSIITYHLVDDEFNDLSSVSMYMTIIVEQ